jgi:tetratricopeptide (TPR) repeat protein/predicted Ser/Thr protein kinase
MVFMTRVVCPLCNTGFEANITRERCALNCVNCGVAFNAAGFLTKEDFAKPAPTPAASGSSTRSASASTFGGEKRVSETGTTPSYADRASTSTRTGGLPFMAENSALPADVKKQLEAAQSQPVHELRDKLKEIRWKLHAKGDSTTVNGNGNGHSPEAANASVHCAVVADSSPSSEKRYADVTVDGIKPAAEVKAEVKAEIKSEVIEKPGADQAKTKAPAIEPAKPKKSPRRPLLEGTFGPYEIEGEIARGGVGAVFRAKETDTGRTVALKVLLEGPEAGESERERFQHECETAKALSLPGMVQVYAVGEIDGRPYMAMELVKGRSLDKVIPEKTLSVNDCLVLMKSVAETIGALHEAGYVHRDLKPGNILIDEFNSPKVADFGLVKSLDEITRLTASGLVCGTPAYMAPEQARGDGKAVDPRSDVWALGAVLYEMLTSKPPFQAENALRLMLKITKDQPKPPRLLNIKVPQDVHYIVMKCLEKSAEKRYPSARAMAEDITRFLNGEPLDIRSQGHERMQKLIATASQNRKPLMVAGIGVAVLLMVAVMSRMFLAPRDAGPVVDRAYKILADPTFKDGDRLDAAEKTFREALTLDAKNGRAYLGLGLVLGRKGIDKQTRKVDSRKVAEAFAMTNQAGELNPQLRPDAFAQAARLKMWMGEHVDEARYLEQAVEYAPTNLKYREALGIAYWNAGVQTNGANYFKSAVAEFQRILNSDATYPKVRDYIKQLQEQYLAVQPGTTIPVATRSRRN